MENYSSLWNVNFDSHFIELLWIKVAWWVFAVVIWFISQSVSQSVKESANPQRQFNKIMLSSKFSFLFLIFPRLLITRILMRKQFMHKFNSLSSVREWVLKIIKNLCSLYLWIFRLFPIFLINFIYIHFLYLQKKCGMIHIFIKMNIFPQKKKLLTFYELGNVSFYSHFREI
jgi:hypothetical protein